MFTMSTPQDTCLLDLSRHKSTSNLMPVISWLKKSYLQVHGNVSIAWEVSVFTTVQATVDMLHLRIKNPVLLTGNAYLTRLNTKKINYVRKFLPEITLSTLCF